MSLAAARSIRIQPRVVSSVSAKKPTQGKPLSSIVNLKSNNNVIVNTTLRAFARYKTDSKGPAKPIQTPQKPQGQQGQQAQKAPSQPPQKPQPSQNNLVTQQPARQELIVNDAPRDPVVVQGEMKQLIEQEVATLETEVKDPYLPEFLKISQFEVVPRKPAELYKLVKTTDNFKIEVTFSTEPPMPEDDENYDMDKELDEDEEEDAAPSKKYKQDEDEDEELGEDEEDEESPWVTPVAVQVKVHFLDQNKGTKGTWELECLAGEEERLFVETMRVHDANGNPVSQTLFDGLSQPIQDKVYDMLDELGVDDNLAKYVQHAIVDELRADEVNFLRTFKGMLLS